MEVSGVARLIGEPARAAMLDALLSGRALAAGELARAAGVSPPTASEHLSRPRGGGRGGVVRAGRRRDYQLAPPPGAAVCGRLLELRWLVRPAGSGRALRLTDTGRRGLAESLGVTAA